MKIFRHFILNPRISISFICAVFIFLNPVQVVFGQALSSDQKKALQTGVYYFNTEEGCYLGSAQTNPVGANASGKVYMIGDSIAEGSAQALDGGFKAKGFSTLELNAKSSRRLSEGGTDLDGLSVLQNDTARISGSNAVVIELGTNGGLSPDNIKKAIAIVKQAAPSANIFWVNIGVDNSKRSGTPINADGLNTILKDNAVAGYGIVDWASQVAQHPDYIDPNPSSGLGVHPTAAGKLALASTIADTASSGGGGTANPAVCKCSVSATLLAGGDNPQKIWNYFVGKGLSALQIAGIMGNLQKESGFNPKRVQGTSTPSGDRDIMVIDGRTGYGIAQWTSAGRQQNLHNLAVSRNTTDGDLGTQLDYLFQEMGGILEGLKQQVDVRAATLFFHDKFERSADGADGLNMRVSFATAILARFGSGGGSVTVSGGSGGGGCGSTASANAAGIVSKAKEYAWPDRSHGMTPTTAYAAAVAQYFPGAGHGGSDCSAFTSIVMIASGADPNYPKASTGAQETYVRAHPEKYDVLPKFNDINELHEGDILIVNSGGGTGADGHTWIYLGGAQKADASQGTRMPAIASVSNKDNQDSRGYYMIARLK